MFIFDPFHWSATSELNCCLMVSLHQSIWECKSTHRNCRTGCKRAGPELADMTAFHDKSVNIKLNLTRVLIMKLIVFIL